jgi:hypothetical protein
MPSVVLTFRKNMAAMTGASLSCGPDYHHQKSILLCFRQCRNSLRYGREESPTLRRFRQLFERNCWACWSLLASNHMSRISKKVYRRQSCLFWPIPRNNFEKFPALSLPATCISSVHELLTFPYHNQILDLLPGGPARVLRL